MDRLRNYGILMVTVLAVVVSRHRTVAAEDAQPACFIIVDRAARNIDRQEARQRLRNHLLGTELREGWRESVTGSWGVEIDRPVVWGRFHAVNQDNIWNTGTFTRYESPDSFRAFIKHKVAERGPNTDVVWHSQNEVSISTAPRTEMRGNTKVKLSFADFHFRYQDGLLLLLPYSGAPVDTEQLNQAIQQTPEDADSGQFFLPQHIPKSVRWNWIHGDTSSVLGSPVQGEPYEFAFLRSYMRRESTLAVQLLDQLESATVHYRGPRIGRGPAWQVSLNPVTDSRLETDVGRLVAREDVTRPPQSKALSAAINLRPPKFLKEELQFLTASLPLLSDTARGVVKQWLNSDSLQWSMQVNATGSAPSLDARIGLGGEATEVSVSWDPLENRMVNAPPQSISGSPLPDGVLLAVDFDVPPERLLDDSPLSLAARWLEREQQRSLFRPLHQRTPQFGRFSEQAADNLFESIISPDIEDADLSGSIKVHVDETGLHVDVSSSFDTYALWQRRVMKSQEAQMKAMRG